MEGAYSLTPTLQETWVDNAANTEEVYNNLRKHRKDLPEWPVTVFGPVEYIKKITKWDVLFAGKPVRSP